SFSTRPSCTATTVALGEVTRSTSCSGAGRSLLAATAPGDGGGAEPAPGDGGGAEPVGDGARAEAAVGAGAVAGVDARPSLCALGASGLGAEIRGAVALQLTRLLRTGRRLSVRPVSAAMTPCG